MAAGKFILLAVIFAGGVGMEKRIRDRIKRVEKLELDLLSDEAMLAEKKEITLLIEALQQELLRRAILISAVVISFVVSMVGLFLSPSKPMLFVCLVTLLGFIALLVQYSQKYKLYNDLYKAADILYK